MAKAAIYGEEAKRLYVQEGFALDTIVGMLGNKVARKTLYNWSIAGEWDAKRKNYLEQTKDIYEEVIAIARMTLREAKLNPTCQNISKMSKAISVLRYSQGVKLLEEETTPKERKGLTGDAIKEIEAELGLL